MDAEYFQQQLQSKQLELQKKTLQQQQKNYQQEMNVANKRYEEEKLAAKNAQYHQEYLERVASAQKQDMINQLMGSTKESQEANKRRETEARGIYGEIISRYGEGGTFGSGIEAELGVQKQKSVAEGTQAAVSAGMANVVGGTQAIGNLGKSFEETVGAPARLKLEDLKMEKLTTAQTNLANFVTNISDEGPDAGLIAQLLNR